MIDAKDAVVWVSRNTKQVMVRPHGWGPTARARTGGISLGAIAQTDEQRMQLMLKTIIDLAVHGFDLKQVLTAFAEIREFRALGIGVPMSRALSAAQIGKTNTVSLEQLRKRKNQ